jgi:FLYWCH zinc finger domain
MESESNKAKTMIIDNGFKYPKYNTTKAGGNCWQCTAKNCTARLTTITDDTSKKHDILSHKHDQNHGEKVDNVAAVVVRVACKRKATSNFGEGPSKIIRLQLVNVDTADQRRRKQFRSGGTTPARSPANSESGGARALPCPTVPAPLLPMQSCRRVK